MSAKKNPDTATDKKVEETNVAKTDEATTNEPAEKTEKIQIVVADDHAVLRESLSALLGTQPDFEVVGSAADGAQALELVQAKHPDVLVLDLFMPGSDGFEVLRTLDKAGSRVATVVLTGSESESDFTNVVRLGGRGL